jgi:NAD+ kinase
VDDGIRVNLRMRFTCTVYRAVTPEQAATCQKRKAIKSTGGDILISQVDAEGWEALEGTKPQEAEKKVKAKRKKDKEIMCFSTRPVETFEVLNDLVVDRGPSPYVSLLELFGESRCEVICQSDGLGRLTPVWLLHRRRSSLDDCTGGWALCCHADRIRPMLLPDGMELRVCVPYNSRSTAWASFDGRGRVELKRKSDL